MALPISFRWDEAFVARIDQARGDVPRSTFVRRAVEQALGELPTLAPRDEYKIRTIRTPVPSPTEQPHRRLPGPNVENVRSSVQSKRDVQPIPKHG